MMHRSPMASPLPANTCYSFVIPVFLLLLLVHPSSRLSVSVSLSSIKKNANDKSQNSKAYYQLKGKWVFRSRSVWSHGGSETSRIDHLCVCASCSLFSVLLSSRCRSSRFSEGQFLNDMSYGSWVHMSNGFCLDLSYKELLLKRCDFFFFIVLFSWK